MPTVDPGDQVQESITKDTTAAVLPKWLKIKQVGDSAPFTYELDGTAQLPSGHRRAVLWVPGSGYEERDYYVPPQWIGPSDAPWRVTIWAGNGSYVKADGATGLPLLGTPQVRIMDNAPRRAVVRIAEMRGSANVLAPTFAGWSDGHQEPISKGMEMLVEYRTEGHLRTAFRGMIYQVADRETVEITAYDRLMDLYQYSGQYQNNLGRSKEWRPRAGDDGTYLYYYASSQIGTLIEVRASDILRIDAQSRMTASFGRTGYVVQPLPTAEGYRPEVGSHIYSVTVKMMATQRDSSFTNKIILRARVILYKLVSNQFQVVAGTEWKGTEIEGSGVVYHTWNLDWTVGQTYYLGAEYRYEVTRGSYTRYGAATTKERNTVGPVWEGYFLYSDDGITWTPATVDDYMPELAINFSQSFNVPVAQAVVSGTSVKVPISSVPTPSGTYLSTQDVGVSAYLDYYVQDAMALSAVAEGLIRHAGLVPLMDAGIDLGSTTYYNSSTYDYLDLLHEMLQGSDYGIIASAEEPGAVIIAPRHTLAEDPVLEVTTAPDGAGERIVLAHDLTAHWAAEKATAAFIAENATDSGLPIALETDDHSFGNSLALDLQSPLRGITADNTLGTHSMLAMVASHKVRQLHTNLLDGTITLAGYRSDLWDMSGKVGGKPIRIIVPEYGIDVSAIPTQIDLADGATRVTLDNVRTADRNDVAASMGRSNDAISNAVRSFPNTVYIFARYYGPLSFPGETPPTGSVTQVQCLLADGTVAATQGASAYIKAVDDAVGYHHVCAIMPANPSGYAADTPIAAVRVRIGMTEYTAPLDNPMYAMPGQMIHIDLRVQTFEV